MENGLQPYEPNTDPATQAFVRLEREMALLRHAVEHLAAEKAEIVIPDYGKTLTEIAKRMSAIVQGQTALAGMPAMQITPESMAARMEAAAEQARRVDRATLKEAREVHLSAAQALRAIVGIAHKARDQRRRLRWAAGGGVFVGMLLMAALPGALARATPERWHWPESMAARILRLDRWSAGERLLATADHERWHAVVLGNRVVQNNQDAIAKCLHTAKDGRPVPCSFTIALPEKASR